MTYYAVTIYNSKVERESTVVWQLLNPSETMHKIGPLLRPAQRILLLLASHTYQNCFRINFGPNKSFSIQYAPHTNF
jgi:hypothetical protein